MAETYETASPGDRMTVDRFGNLVIEIDHD
jgi:hypothetical protein